MPQPGLTDRVAIVTGAGSGIGAATVRRLVADGAKVVLVGRTEDKLQRVADDLDGDRVLVHPCDVSDDDAVQRMVDACVEHFGTVDLVVNNAGIGRPGDVTEVGLDAFDLTMAINVGGIHHVSRAAMPHLRGGGAIVNVGSVSGSGGDWGMAAYNASKGAVHNLSRAMALDHASEGVRVNVVAPSLTRTPMAEGITSNDDMMDAFSTRIPMGRPAEPDEVAGVVAFLCGDDAGFVTGTVVHVDGGLSASNGQPPLG